MAKKKSRFRQEATDEQLTERTEQSYNSRESSGKFNDYFKDDLPLPKWFCNEGDHAIDVIPFLAGKDHPNVAEGKPTHNVDIYVHYNIGVTESSYVCPARMGIGACPICEFQAALKKQKNYDEEYVKGFNAKRRVIYNVLVYDTQKDIDAGMMIWEASHHLAEKNIMAIARNKRSGGFIKWASPDVGKTVEFTREGKGISTKYVGFTFSDREDAKGNIEPISDEILDEAITIDEYLKILSYEELAEVLGDVSIPDDGPLEEEESYENVNKRTPRNSRRRTAKEEEPESEEETEEDREPEEEEKPKSRRRRRTGRTEEPDDASEEETETGTTLRRRRSRR